MDYLIVIPARLSSTRLPRKPLIDICGKSMLERTYGCALKAINDRDKIIIATDSKEIINECEKFDAKCILTSKDCLTGTDRVAEVSRLIEANQYINLQGDEPIFPFESIQKFINLCSKQIDSVHTCVTKITKKEDFFNESLFIIGCIPDPTPVQCKFGCNDCNSKFWKDTPRMRDHLKEVEEFYKTHT